MAFAIWMAVFRSTSSALVTFCQCRQSSAPIMQMSHKTEQVIIVHMLRRRLSSRPFPQFWLYVAPCPMLTVVLD